MHDKALSKVASRLPISFQKTIMHFMVRSSYNSNYYNEVYRTHRELSPFEHQILSMYIKELNNKRPYIMDIGCGAGIPFDSYFIKKGCKIVGLDLSKTQIQRAKNNIPLAKFINTDFLIYRDNNYYDGIVLLYSLFHIQREYHIEVMQKVYNMLKPNGKVLLNIREEDCGSLKYRRDFCGMPMCWSHYDKNTFLNIISKIGFKYKQLGDEKMYGSSESHLWIILSKA